MNFPGIFHRINYRIVDRILDGRMKRAGLHQRVADLPAFTIRYWDSENGKPPLVLMQAFTAENKFTWQKQVKGLAKKFRLIIPNLVHFGGSTAKHPEYNVQEQVNALAALLGFLKTGPVFICGASYSGIVSTEFARQFPDRVRSLALIAMPVKYITDADRARTYAHFGVSNRISLLVPDDHRMVRNLISLAYHKPPFIPLYILKSIYLNLYLRQKEDRKKVLEAFDREQPVFDAKDYRFNFPVLLVWGAEDRMVPLSAGKKLAQHMGSNTRLEIFESCGHLPNLEKPEQFNELLTGFFS